MTKWTTILTRRVRRWRVSSDVWDWSGKTNTLAVRAEHRETLSSADCCLRGPITSATSPVYRSSRPSAVSCATTRERFGSHGSCTRAYATSLGGVTWRRKRIAIGPRYPPTALLTGAKDGTLRWWDLGGSRPEGGGRAQISIISDMTNAGVSRKPSCTKQAHTGAMLCMSILNLADLDVEDGWREAAVAQVQWLITSCARKRAKAAQEARAWAESEQETKRAAAATAAAHAEEVTQVARDAARAVRGVGGDEREAERAARVAANAAAAAAMAAIAAAHVRPAGGGGAGMTSSGGREEEEGWVTTSQDGVHPMDRSRLPLGLVATGGSEGLVKVWDVASAECLHVLKGHTHGVLSVAFSLPQRRASAKTPVLPLMTGSQADPKASVWLISGSHDHEVRIWDVGSGAALRSMTHHCGPVTLTQTKAAQIATLAPGDGLAVFLRRAFDPDGDKRPKKGTPGGGGGDGGGGGEGRVRGNKVGDRLRQQIASARGGGGTVAGESRDMSEKEKEKEKWREELGMDEVLSMLDGPSVTFATSFTMDRKGMAVGTQTGEVRLLRYTGD